MAQKFFTDGSNILALVSGDGELGTLKELRAGTTDAATEKHVPVYETANGVCTVKIGSAAHPMLEEHSINWVVVVTNKGTYTKYLAPGTEPAARFLLDEDETVENVFEYCNLHKLWKA